MERRKDWPHCIQIDDVCPVYELCKLLGITVFDSLVEFSACAQAGSRLTLQRNQSEFTSQITGSVQKAGGNVIDVDGLKQFNKKIRIS